MKRRLTVQESLLLLITLGFGATIVVLGSHWLRLLLLLAALGYLLPTLMAARMTRRARLRLASIDASDPLFHYQLLLAAGRHYGACFALHNLVWAVTVLFLAFLFLILAGARLWVMVINVAAIAYAVYAVVGFLWRPAPTLASVCWRSRTPAGIRNPLARTAAAIILNQRYQAAASDSREAFFQIVRTEALARQGKSSPWKVDIQPLHEHHFRVELFHRLSSFPAFLAGALLFLALFSLLGIATPPPTSAFPGGTALFDEQTAVALMTPPAGSDQGSTTAMAAGDGAQGTAGSTESETATGAGEGLNASQADGDGGGDGEQTGEDVGGEAAEGSSASEGSADTSSEGNGNSGSGGDGSQPATQDESEGGEGSNEGEETGSDGQGSEDSQGVGSDDVSGNETEPTEGANQSEEGGTQGGAGGDAADTDNMADGTSGGSQEDSDGQPGAEGEPGADSAQTAEGLGGDNTSEDSQGAEGAGGSDLEEGQKEQSESGEQGASDQPGSDAGAQGSGSGDGSDDPSSVPGSDERSPLDNEDKETGAASNQQSQAEGGSEGTSGGWQTPPASDVPPPNFMPPGGSDSIVNLELPSMYPGTGSDDANEESDGGELPEDEADEALSENRASDGRRSALPTAPLQRLPNWIQVLLRRFQHR